MFFLRPAYAVCLPPLAVFLLFAFAALPLRAQQKIELEQAPQPPRERAQPLSLKPDAPGAHQIHRLILKDGSYQLVRQYSVSGERLRYQSSERGDWEELPLDLIDWQATRRWERDQNAPADEELSPAMREARQIDREENEEVQNQKARMPEVATGLKLPDQEGVFALDRFEGSAELVELVPADLNINAKTHKGVGTLNPLAGRNLALELDGAHASVHLHDQQPTLYLSLGVLDEKEPLLSHAVVVDTSNTRAAANPRHGAHSTHSGFAIVRLDQRRAVRLVGAIHVSLKGEVRQDEDVLPASDELLAGKRWLKIIPTEKLTPGEYALVEVLSADEISQSVWDFRIDPASGRNPGSLSAIEAHPASR